MSLTLIGKHHYAAINLQLVDYLSTAIYSIRKID